MIDIYIIIGGILLLVGAVFLLDGIFKSNKFIKNRTWSIIIGAVLILVGFFGTGFGTMFEAWTAEEAPAVPATVCASWSVTPSVSSSLATLNSGEDKFTVMYRANSTSHVITERDNTTWVNPVLQFICKPIVPQGATADDLATIYYEVTNPDMTATDGTDTYKIFTLSSGNRQLIWTGDGTEYVSGTCSLLMTENVTLLLTMTCSQDSLSRTENVGDSETATIKFSNGCGWSETIAVDFDLIETWAGD